MPPKLPPITVRFQCRLSAHSGTWRASTKRKTGSLAGIFWKGRVMKMAEEVRVELTEDVLDALLRV